MKKRILALFLSTLLLSGALAGCGPAEETPKASGGDEPIAADGAKPKFCFVVTSQLGDKSFNDSAAAGMDMITEQLGCETKILEIGSDQTKWEPTLMDLSDTGEYEAIIVNGSGTSEIIEKLAEEFRDQKYVMFDTTIEEGANPNVYAISYKQNEGSYLGGVLAGLVTISDMPNANADKKIGFIGGEEDPIISDFLVGYIEGAQSVDPDIKVYVSYVGSWTDTAKGKELALAQYNQGVDILFPAAMTSGLGCIEAAVEQGKYIIGVDSDQALLFEGTDENSANVILTSVMKEVGKSLVRFAEKDMDGSLPWGTSETMGIKEGASDIAMNKYYEKNVTQDIRDKVDEARQAVLDGKVQVTSALGLPADELKAILDSCKP